MSKKDDDEETEDDELKENVKMKFICCFPVAALNINLAFICLPSLV